MNAEILNKALNQEFPIDSIEKLSTGQTVTFTTTRNCSFLHVTDLSPRIKCVYNSKAYTLTVYRDGKEINTYPYASTDPFRLVCEKIIELKQRL